MGRSGKCIATLNALGRAMGQYHAEYKESFWPTALRDHPRKGVTTYFWGTNTIPVETDTSPLLAFCGRDVTYLQGQRYLEPHPKELMVRNHV